MLVMKFGGSSMGNAKKMEAVALIIKEKSLHSRISVIVSAVAGVSNFLQNSIFEAIQQNVQHKEKDSIFTSKKVEELKNIHTNIMDELKNKNTDFSVTYVLDKISIYFIEFEKLLTAIVAFGECPESIEARVMGLGEQICVPIFAEVLKSIGLAVLVVDSREFIITDGSLIEGEPIYEEVETRLQNLQNEKTPVILAAGFISRDMNGKPSLLGRNGSDFSAALFAFGLHAQGLEIWTDVDGIYTADPRIVHDAVLVQDLSYEEAMELSFFGSKVLHPKTLIPITARKIETRSLNTFNPLAPGTRITCANQLTQEQETGPVRGISCLKNTSMISVTGAGLKGKKGIAARTFHAVSRADVSILLITQSSSEYTISFCVKGSEATKVVKVLEQEFALEMREKLINEISVIQDMAIVSIVGDGMRQKKGIAGTFFSSLAFGGINIYAIAQGSSERSISTVIAGEDGDKAVKIAHRFFFNTAQPINIFLFGTGLIGAKLLDQIKQQQKDLKHKRIDLKVCGIANSQSMVLSRDGIDLDNWKNLLALSKEKTSVKKVLDFVKNEKPLNPVCVDSTAADSLPEQYIDFFDHGMHVVTPNKRANSLSWDYYKKIRTKAANNRCRFLYEANVGGGLPIIGTFQDMLKSGDSLISFSGILSGSMSYIFGRLDEGISFSQAVQEAKEKGFTEPDPRDDLSGMDVARKVLIIAREAGYQLELEDITILSLYPKGFSTKGSVLDFFNRLPELNSWFFKKIEEVKKQNMVLRFVATIDGVKGIAQVGLKEVPGDSPLGVIKNGENVFVFTSRYYSPIPLVIRGYGAGADVTASGVFADILRTLKW